MKNKKKVKPEKSEDFSVPKNLKKFLRFSDILEELENSHEFGKFKKEHSKSYLSAGFFVFDFETNKILRQIDFSTKDKIFTFLLDENCRYKEENKQDKEAGELKVPSELKVDLWNLKDYVDEQIEIKQLNKKIVKIIAVLQVHDDVLKWNLSCILNDFKMLKLHIDAMKGTVLYSDVSNMFDFMKMMQKEKE